MTSPTHRTVEPAILYLGTPVVLVSSLNPDGSTNIAPMSSAWWLGWSCMLGFDATSQTPRNLARQPECVLNLPAAELVAAIDRLAATTAASPMPPHKSMLGYRSEPDKWKVAGLTRLPADDVAPDRIAECPIHLEGVAVARHAFGAEDPRLLVPSVAIEVRIVKVHVDEGLLSKEFDDRIDPQVWKPLIMSFRQFFSTGDMLRPSRLAIPPEEAYGGRAPRRRTTP